MARPAQTAQSKLNFMHSYKTQKLSRNVTCKYAKGSADLRMRSCCTTHPHTHTHMYTHTGVHACYSLSLSIHPTTSICNNSAFLMVCWSDDETQFNLILLLLPVSLATERRVAHAQKRSQGVRRPCAICRAPTGKA